MQSPRMATLCAYPVIGVPLSCGGVVAKESSLRGRTSNGPQLLLSPPSPPSPPPPKPTNNLSNSDLRPPTLAL